MPAKRLTYFSCLLNMFQNHINSFYEQNITTYPNNQNAKELRHCHFSLKIWDVIIEYIVALLSCL